MGLAAYGIAASRTRDSAPPVPMHGSRARMHDDSIVDPGGGQQRGPIARRPLQAESAGAQVERRARGVEGTYVGGHGGGGHSVAVDERQGTGKRRWIRAKLVFPGGL